MTHRTGLVALVLGLSVSLVACGGKEMTVHLDNGGGLAEGAPVEVNGVTIGQVSDVTVTGDGVDVTARLEQDLELHADACALAGGQTPKLYVHTGEAAEPFADGPVPQCDIGAELGAAMGEAAEQLGNLLRGFGAAVTGQSGQQPGQAGSGQAAPTPTPTAPTTGASGGSVNGMATNEQIRNAGRALGEATRNFGEGFFEGAVGADGQGATVMGGGGAAAQPNGAGTMPPPPGFQP